jgi:peptidoglycan/xylan/chitin deacetylase (PgdA/CDA1 family)
VVLAYHGISNQQMFVKQIEFLAATMRPLALEDAMRAMCEGTRLPSGSVLVTFDDGDPSVYDAGLPVLQRFRIPAAIFVVAGLIGTSRPFWWDEVAALVKRGGRTAAVACHDPEDCVRRLKTCSDETRLAAIDQLRQSAGGQPVEARQLTARELRTLVESGVAVGNHTLTHPCLDRCSDRRLRAEVADAHALLSDVLGWAPRVFAYPNGNADPRIPPILRSLGYEAAVVFDHRIGRLPPADRFRISRVRVNSSDSLERFRLIVSGLHPRVHAAMGRV